MAAINRSVALNVVANVEGYQREFMKLPGITEKQATAAALKMVNAFSRAEAKIAVDSAKAAQRATRTITTSTTRATRAMATAGRSSAATLTQATQAVAIQIPDVITQLSMGTSPMQVLIQQGLQPVQVMLPQIMSALSGLGTAFGVAGIAVAAAGTAYVVFANAAEEAAEANGRLTARVEEATSAHNRAITAANGHARAELALSRAIVEAERATSVILGDITKEESERLGLVETINAQSHAMIRDASLAVSQGERRQQAINNELRSTEISFERRTTLIDQLGTVEEQLDRDRKRFADAQAQRDAAIEAGTNRLFEQLSAERAKEAAKVEETERKKREALRKTADEERRAAEERAAREAEAATEALAGLESQLARDQAGALDLVNMKYDERLAKLREIEETLGTSQRTIALGFDIEEQRIAEIEALRDETRAKRMAQIEADAAEEVAIRQRSADAIRAATMGLISTTSAAFMQAAQRQVETNREGAMRSFRISKALNIAEAVMNTQAAASRALKDYVFPASAVVAGLVAATGAIRVGMIASQQPSFDVGGVVGGGIVGAPMPDQQPARLLAGEAVLNRTATASLGAEGVRALNRGEDIAPRVVVVDAFRHFDRFMGDELGRGGRLTRALDGQREYPIGQRGY
jgi:colicin import membrane protein